MVPTHPNLRIMVDAGVLVAGVGWPGFLHEILQHAVAGDFQLVLSPFVLEEAYACALRLCPAQIRQFDVLLQTIEKEIVPMPTLSELASAPRLTRDPIDLPLVMAAIKAQVDWFISVDRSLSEPTILLHRYLKVVSPATFLRQSMGWSRDDLLRIRDRTWKEMEAPSA